MCATPFKGNCLKLTQPSYQFWNSISYVNIIFCIDTLVKILLTEHASIEDSTTSPTDLAMRRPCCGCDGMAYDVREHVREWGKTSVIDMIDIRSHPNLNLTLNTNGLLWPINSLLEAKLPYEPSCPSVGWLVGQSVGLSTGALVLSYIKYAMIALFVLFLLFVCMYMIRWFDGHFIHGST